MGWGRLFTAVLVLAAIVALVIHYRAELGSRVVEVDRWIGELGIWGPLVFFWAFVPLTLVFVPDSALCAVAGALFGTLVGTGVAIIGALVAQGTAFGISRHFLRRRVSGWITGRPKLAAIAQAAEREGFRLQFLLRLSPINPVLISYVVGTTRSPFPVFLLASLGMVPGLFVEVYCGYTAKHMVKVVGQVSDHTALQTTLVVVGLIACILLFIIVTRMAQRALAAAELQAG